jgi:methylmalonyl-CoA mutase N-terminal domain/subunit
VREAGCDAVQEIAFAFSNAITYVESGLKAGLRVDEFAPRISWIFNCGNNLFEEVPLLRLRQDTFRERFRKGPIVTSGKSNRVNGF